MGRAKNSIFSNIRAQTSKLFNSAAIKQTIRDYDREFSRNVVYKDVRDRLAPKDFVKNIDKRNAKKVASEPIEQYNNLLKSAKENILPFEASSLSNRLKVAEEYISSHINDIDLAIGGEIAPEMKEALEKQVAQDLLMHCTVGKEASSKISEEELKELVIRDAKMLKDRVKYKRVPSMLNQYYAAPVINSKNAFINKDANALKNNLKTIGVRAGATAGVGLTANAVTQSTVNTITGDTSQL